MIPIEDLLGASILSLAAITLVMVSAAGLAYAKNSGKRAELEAKTDNQNALNQASLISIQRSQHKLMRKIGTVTMRTDKRVETNVMLLRRVVKQLQSLTNEQKTHNGNAQTIRRLIDDIKTYIER